MLLIKLKTKLLSHLIQPVNILIGLRKFDVFQKCRKCRKKGKKKTSKYFWKRFLWLLGEEQYATADFFRIIPQISYLALGNYRLSIKISYFLQSGIKIVKYIWVAKLNTVGWNWMNTSTSNCTPEGQTTKNGYFLSRFVAVLKPVIVKHSKNIALQNTS